MTIKKPFRVGAGTVNIWVNPMNTILINSIIVKPKLIKDMQNAFFVPPCSAVAKQPYLIKTVRVMKMVIILTLAACLHAGAKGYSQTITLSLKNVSLKKAFAEIQKQSDYSFIYTKEELENASPVTIIMKDASIYEVLEVCFKGQPVTFTIEEKFIIIKIANNKKEVIALFHDVKGRVVNENGEGVIATITVKGTTNAVSTDTDGYFLFKNLENEATLVITGVGIEAYELEVNGKTDLATITIKTKVISGAEIKVVSTGYQLIPKERATGSFDQPDKTMFNSRVSTDVLIKLEGITGGLLFNTPGITASDDAEISIRGRSTIFANSQPLIVVDNFPYEGDIRNINPNDVENITILKDAAASSIWGVRAGNGVIVITSKQGKLNQPLKISFNSNVTVVRKPDLLYDPGFLNSSDFIDVEKILFNQNFYDASIASGYEPLTPVVEILRQRSIGILSPAEANLKIDDLRNRDIRNDLSKYFYRKAVNQQYALNFSGGSKKTSYYFSLGYDNNRLSQLKNSYDRITLNSLGMFIPIKNLSFTTGIHYIQNKSETDNTLTNLLTAFKGNIYSYASVADELGNLLPVTTQYSPTFSKTATDKGFLNWQFYPLDELRSGSNKRKVNGDDIRIFEKLSYKIIKGLDAEIKYQYQKYSTASKNLARLESFYARNFINMYSAVDANGQVIDYNIKPGAILSLSNSSVESNNIRADLTFNNRWSHQTIAAIAGFEARQTTGQDNGSFFYGYDEATGSFQNVNTTSAFIINPYGYSATIPAAGSSLNGTIDRFRSFFENAAYTYNDKYTMSISSRIDASNYFGVETNQKKVPLWSMGSKWDIDREKKYHVSWLPYLKLRATYGYGGNLDKSVTAVTTFRYYDFTSSLTNLKFAQISNLGNPELRWEKIGIFNAGIDFALKNNVVQGTIDYYHKQGKDLMGDAILDPTTGITQIRGNFSRMTGKGIDVKLTTNNIDKKFKWITTTILSWNTDKITKYDGKIVPSNLISSDKNIYPRTGNPVFGIYSYKWAGLDPSDGDPQGYDAQKQINKDYSALINPASFDELIYNGPARPQIFGGVINHFSYKEFALSVSISYKLHYYFRAGSINYFNFYNYLLGHSDFSMRWQKPGDENNTNVPSMPDLTTLNSSRDYFYNNSEVTVKKGDFVRIQDINLSYNLTKSQSRNLPVDNLQFYLYLNNVGLLWKANKEGLDPDYPSGIPVSRSISLGIKTNF